MGRWSRPAAEAFLAWLAPPAGSRWLDVGCGTGALTRAILTNADPREVVGIDPSSGFIASARERIDDERVRFEIGDARELPAPSETFDAVVAGLALNFVPDPEGAVAEMARVVRPGGVVAAYVWDYAGEMQMLRFFWEAAIALDSDVARLNQGERFPICQPGPLAASFVGAGLRAVEVEAIDTPMRFRDFDDYWLPFLLTGPAPAQRYIAALDEEGRLALREELRRTLPSAADGSIPLIARAWAVRGTSV